MSIDRRLEVNCRAAFVVMAAIGSFCFARPSSAAQDPPTAEDDGADEGACDTTHAAADGDDECTLSNPDCPSDDESRNSERVTLGLEGDLLSRYIWRGLALSTGPVLQPSVWASLRNFTVGATANVNLHDEATLKGVDFFMPEVSYRWRLQKFVVEPGVIAYVDQPGRSPSGDVRSSTAEASLKLSYGVGPLLLSSANYLDAVIRPGAYYGSGALQVAKCVSHGLLRAYVEIGWASASFNGEHHEADIGGLSIAGGGAEVRADLGETFYLALHTEATTLIKHALRSGTREPDLYNVGLAVGGEVSP